MPTVKRRTPAPGHHGSHDNQDLHHLICNLLNDLDWPVSGGGAFSLSPPTLGRTAFGMESGNGCFESFFCLTQPPPPGYLHMPLLRCYTARRHTSHIEHGLICHRRGGVAVVGCSTLWKMMLDSPSCWIPRTDLDGGLCSRAGLAVAPGQVSGEPVQM